MNAIILTLALCCGGGCEVAGDTPVVDVREVLEQRLYEDGYNARINVRYWGVIASRDEAAWWARFYVVAGVWVAIACVLGYACYSDSPGLFFGVLIPSLMLTVIAMFAAGLRCETSNRIQDRWRTVAHKCEQIERGIEVSAEPITRRLIEDVDAISSEILAIENQEPPMTDPEEDTKLLAKCQHDQNVAQGSVD